MEKHRYAALEKRAAVKSVSVIVLVPGLIFLCAGRWLYWQGILYTALTIAMFAASALFAAHDPGLIREKLKPGQGVQAWDRAYLSASARLYFMTLVLSALDAGRFGLSPALPAHAYAAASVLYIAGNLLFAWAKRANRFFSPVVRIQTDRGHRVCRDGPYRTVRHPGYLGGMLHTAVTPLLLGSLWGLIPTGLALVLMLARTALEDQTLEEELEGYREYQKEVKYRLVPYIW